MRKYLLALVDTSLVAVASLAALALRSNFDLDWAQFVAFGPYLISSIFTAAVIFFWSGTHLQIWRFSGLPDYMRLVNLTLAIVLCTVLANFAFNRLGGVARSLPIVQFVLATMFLVGARVLYRLHRARRAGGRDFTFTMPLSSDNSILLVGLNPVTELFVGCARAYAANRMNICGLVTERPRQATGEVAYGVPVLGDISKLPELLATLPIHGVVVRRIIVTADANQLSETNRGIIAGLERRSDLKVEYLSETLDFVDRRSRVATDVSIVTTERRNVSTLESAAARRFWVAKYGFDFLLAAILITLLAVPLALIAGLVLATMGAPVTFWQYRPGRHGVQFKVLKFRSMHAAHGVDGQPLPDVERAPLVGRLLRLTRLDELPQLFNVLRGSMSFVGPRPLLLSEQARYPAARLLVRPGLTGWAQVNGGRELSIDDKLLLDLWYMKHASFALDFKIAIQTIQILFRGERPNAAAITAAREEFSSYWASADDGWREHEPAERRTVTATDAKVVVDRFDLFVAPKLADSTGLPPVESVRLG